MALLCMIAARPVTAASMAGTMPIEQPPDANTLPLVPCARPVATAYSAPAPGVATTINEVSRNASVMTCTVPFCARLVKNAAGSGAGERSTGATQLPHEW